MPEKHAFLIMAHGHISILNKLLTMLDDPRNDIFLHIDRHWRDFDFEACKRLVSKAGLVFTPRIKVFWGHSSQIDCELLLLGECLKQGRYAFVHLISGVDLPIKTQDEIHAFFDSHPDTQFIQVGNAEKFMDRITKYHFFMRFNMVPMRLRSAADSVLNFLIGLTRGTLRLNRLKKYGDMHIVKTANWFSLTYDCAAFVYSQRDFITKLTRHSLCADEMFPGTVMYMSPYWDEVYCKEVSWEGHMRYIDRIRNVGASPHTFTIDDKEMIDSSEMLFARKFDENVDNDIIEYVFSRFRG